MYMYIYVYIYIYIYMYIHMYIYVCVLRHAQRGVLVNEEMGGCEYNERSEGGMLNVGFL